MQGNWQAAAPAQVRRNFELLANYGVMHVAWVHSWNYYD